MRFQDEAIHVVHLTGAKRERSLRCGIVSRCTGRLADSVQLDCAGVVGDNDGTFQNRDHRAAAFLVDGHTVFRAANTDRSGRRADCYVLRIELADLTTGDHERTLHQGE